MDPLTVCIDKNGIIHVDKRRFKSVELDAIYGETGEPWDYYVNDIPVSKKTFLYEALPNLLFKIISVAAGGVAGTTFRSIAMKIETDSAIEKGKEGPSLFTKVWVHLAGMGIGSAVQQSVEKSFVQGRNPISFGMGSKKLYASRILRLKALERAKDGDTLDRLEDLIVEQYEKEHGTVDSINKAFEVLDDDAGITPLNITKEQNTDE